MGDRKLKVVVELEGVVDMEGRFHEATASSCEIRQGPNMAIHDAKVCDAARQAAIAAARQWTFEPATRYGDPTCVVHSVQVNLGEEARSGPSPVANCPQPPVYVNWQNQTPPIVEAPRRVKWSGGSDRLAEFARDRKLDVNVIVMGTIDIDGNIGDVTLVSCKITKRGKEIEGADKDEYCRMATTWFVEAITTWKYDPATRDGAPVCVYTTLSQTQRAE
ncbi:MAG TPA: hypothetical protein VJ826_15895 [Candidatus Polarisedimenticolaceae bacterium]|nr:hypothetical protein [Candidatus Polarisedimenticolaceae bacterium]